MEVLGIDIGGSGIKGAIVDTDRGKLLTERHRIETPQPATPNAVVTIVGEIVDHFKWHGPVGCGFPAALKHGIVSTAANIDDSWIGLDAGAMIRKKTGCPIHIMNDADAAGLAEMKFGSGKDFDGTVMMIGIGTGIGTSFFSAGVLFPNSELGQLILPNGKKAEKYASNATRKQEALSWEQWTGRVNEFLDFIGFLVWPDRMIIGGGVVKYHQEFFHLLKANSELVPAELLNYAGIIGSALYCGYGEQHISSGLNISL